ncbi:plasmid stabilization protein [Rhizobium sp. Leaf155]|nr:plasmid stabilization protein [Rhizobium sp. Leaf155]
MKRHMVRLTPEAQNDLVSIYDYIVDVSGPSRVADRYLDRIGKFLSGLSVFPERGTLRDDVRDGLRIIGFERNASVAFIVEDESIIVLRILGKGQEFRQANKD